MVSQKRIKNNRMISGLLFLLLVVVSSLPTANAQQEVELTPQEFYKLNSNGEWGLIVDIRDSSLWVRGHIENATHVENFGVLLTNTRANQINNTLRELGIFSCLQKCTTIVYCRSARVAGITIDLLRNKAGFIGATIYNGGGTRQWAEAGYPLVFKPSIEPSCMENSHLGGNICGSASASASAKKTP